MHEDIPILNFLVPKEFTHDDGKLTGMTFEKVEAEYDERAAAGWCRPASRISSSNATTCWSRSARRTPSPGSSATSASSSTNGTCRWSTRRRCSRPTQACSSAATRRSARRTSSGRSRTATRRRSRSTSSARARTCSDRPPPGVTLSSQKMGIHEWSYDNDVSLDLRYKVPQRDKAIALKNIKAEVELGFDWQAGLREAQRCLNCDVQTVFTDKLCIECDACVDICPIDCITFTDNGEEAELRTRLSAPAHQSDPGPLRLRRAEDRPHHGQGRGRLPALRTVRRTLPDRRMGHGTFSHRRGPGGYNGAENACCSK